MMNQEEGILLVVILNLKVQCKGLVYVIIKKHLKVYGSTTKVNQMIT